MAFVEPRAATGAAASRGGLDGDGAHCLRVHGAQRPELVPKGDEVWFSATRASGAAHQIHAVSLSGRERLLAEGAGTFELFDVSSHPDLGRS